MLFWGTVFANLSGFIEPRLVNEKPMNGRYSIELEECLAMRSSGFLNSPTGRGCTQLEFRYFIISNELRSKKVRHIEIFMDESSFSTENLSILFQVISSAYPTPTRLSISVNTDWKQYQLPISPGCPGVAETYESMERAQRKIVDERFLGHYADFNRRIGDRFFIYNPTKRERKTKRVYLRD